MAFPIPPISSPAFRPAAPTQANPVDGSQAGQTAQPGQTSAAEAGDGFTQAIGDALDNLNALDGTVEQASRQAATGDLESVSDFMIATSEAQLATEITVAVRDRAVTAFNDIMRMQI